VKDGVGRCQRGFKVVQSGHFANVLRGKGIRNEENVSDDLHVIPDDGELSYFSGSIESDDASNSHQTITAIRVLGLLQCLSDEISDVAFVVDCFSELGNIFFGVFSQLEGLSNSSEKALYFHVKYTNLLLKARTTSNTTIQSFSVPSSSSSTRSTINPSVTTTRPSNPLQMIQYGCLSSLSSLSSLYAAGTPVPAPIYCSS